ncbi:UDP-N-acetylmuramoyl-L-alanyl-D-glutamate--2,6-diaminopimelate ligase [Patescibacteria group bacterium]|nr:UDP-N-acetylmuramoyl-L-alanyl-D-glutamate--2,6-diaminopimelate ligase [Patescibacteria group bacterium]
MKALLKKILPKSLLNHYHKFLAVFASYYYGNPSEKMIVIGVTGTNGKSTTANLIARALEADGAKTGMTSTVNFKVADREWLNNKKMTMLGRFQLQKLLKQMVDCGCKFAVIETSSEGIKQFRHLGINYDYVVFTNLTPEHLESHGGFENYKKAKGKLFAHLMEKKRKKLFGREIPKVSVINIDDEHAPYFLNFPADKKLKFSVEKSGDDILRASEINVSLNGTSFTVKNERINLKLIGAFNVENALPAIAIGLNEGIPLEKLKEKLEAVKLVDGRMEIINEGQDFSVIVDYAPEPYSLKKCYETIVGAQDFAPDSAAADIQNKNNVFSGKIIHVLGSCGGGRDRARRPILGKMAGEFADVAIVTDEDPYDDDPMEIIDQVAEGAISAGKVIDKNLFKISDRKQAIEKAISLAKTNDLVLVTGKGSEQAMAVAGGKYLPWDDRKVIREALKARLK